MKNELRTLLISSVLGLPAFAGAQEPSPPSTTPSVPQTTAPAGGAQRWIDQLGSDSYQQRLEAERRLRELGSVAVPLLEAAAKQTKDVEVQWRARRLLRQIDGGGGGGLVERARSDDATQSPEDAQPPNGTRSRSGEQRRLGQGNGGQLRDEFDQLFRRFEQDFGVDVPRGRFFSDDFFRDLQQQLQSQGQNGPSHGMSMQVGPDGVRVEVEEVGADGKTEKKVYEAPDMKTFREQYPDVLQHNGLGMGIDLDFGADVPGLGGLGGLRARLLPIVRDLDVQGARPRLLPFDRLRRLQQQPLGVAPPADADAVPDALPVAPMPPAGQRLGVVVRDLPDTLREYLELGPGVGLMVAEVQADTLASALGLQPNDVVVRIGAHSIGSPADVQVSLGAIAKGDQVVVEFVRKGRHQTAETQKLAAAEATPKRLQERGTIR